MPLAASQFDHLRDIVANRSGNVLTLAQDYFIESRLRSLSRSLGLESVEGLIVEMEKSPDSHLHDLIAEAMTINETSFFRDEHPFHELKTSILPSILRERESVKRLSIWSAACSSGQEPYSLAILLREEFPQLHDWKLYILASDFSSEMLKRTTNGVYSDFEVKRGLSPYLLNKYFTKINNGWKVNSEIQKMVECLKINLVSDRFEFGRFDVIFLRNVLIYFHRFQKESVLRRLHCSIAPYGRLILGGGETLINMHVPYARETLSKVACYRPVT